MMFSLTIVPDNFAYAYDKHPILLLKMISYPDFHCILQLIVHSELIPCVKLDLCFPKEISYILKPGLEFNPG